MKKTFALLFTFILCFSVSLVSVHAEETLDQLQEKARNNRSAYSKAKSQKELTIEERDKATAQKKEVEAEIAKIKTDLTNTQNEIKKLQETIITKDKEIKNLMKFVQISNGESNYLEYAFGASTFTDFIYRISVAEELSEHNDELIKEYNATVKKLEIKQKELTTKQNELSKKQEELAIIEAQLNMELEHISEGMQSKEDEYKTTIDLINSLKSLGCSGNETMTSCQNRIYKPAPAASSNSTNSTSSSGGNGNISVTSSNGTYMPLSSGYLTSDFGSCAGRYDCHTGMDFSSGRVDNVYPVAPGTVLFVRVPSSRNGIYTTCGNYIVYVLHKINGVFYTTSYWHLTSVSVSKGQSIAATTKIGTIAGPGYKDGCDSSGNNCCAYGGHVHLNLFHGITTSNSGRINPRIIIPQTVSEGGYFSHR